MKKRIKAQTDEAQDFLNQSVPEGIVIEVENQVIQGVKVNGTYDLSNISMRQLLSDAAGGGYYVTHAGPFKKPEDVHRKYPDGEFGVKHVSSLGRDLVSKATKDYEQMTADEKEYYLINTVGMPEHEAKRLAHASK